MPAEPQCPSTSRQHRPFRRASRHRRLCRHVNRQHRSNLPGHNPCRHGMPRNHPCRPVNRQTLRQVVVAQRVLGTGTLPPHWVKVPVPMTPFPIHRQVIITVHHRSVRFKRSRHHRSIRPDRHSPLYPDRQHLRSHHISRFRPLNPFRRIVLGQGAGGRGQKIIFPQVGTGHALSTLRHRRCPISRRSQVA